MKPSAMLAWIANAPTTSACPTGSGKMMNLFEVSRDLADRLGKIFLKNELRYAPGLRRHREVPRPA